MKRFVLLIALVLVTLSAMAFPPVGNDKATTDSVRAFLGLTPDQPLPVVREPRAPDPRASVQFRTEDGVILHGTYGRAVGGDKGTVILVHQQNGTRRDFADFERFLLSNGYSIMSFDLRGTGESTKTEEGETIDQSKFKAGKEGNDFLGLPKDVEAAIAWLEQKGFHGKRDKLFVLGAGTGCNVGGVAAVKNASHVDGFILVSPLSTYRGLDLAAELKNIQGRPILALASAQDSSSVNVLRTLSSRNRDLRQQLIPEKGYARELLATKTGRTQILNFLNANTKN
ncbi:alpha/beta hydrolase [bacterium]|nr:alpha/beta hydrolase [bacterium]